jgi:single-stranded-DNA-specific exonuclease
MSAKKFKLKEKKWLIANAFSNDSERKIKAIADGLGINPIIANLLYGRGYKTPAEAKKFLYMETEVLTDPYAMADMERAVDRITLALDRGEKITVYGDYDVDGVTSVCTLLLYLRSHGADVNYYIPNRTGEGYGVSQSAIDSLAAEGTKLIITVDTGITADAEVEYAAGIGVDFVVTDHHECRSVLPKAVAVVNPHRPDCPSLFKEIAGVGVVFKLICALEERIMKLSTEAAAMRIISEYADLVAIGTIADVMPIREENRLIVSYGLSLVQNTKRPGISALIAASIGKNEAQRSANKKKNVKITSSYIGFTLAPRINAAGRIKTADMAVELFLSSDYKHAYSIAEDLCEANKERQNEENRIMQDAYRIIDEKGYANMPVIVLDSDNWHHGVIGIVSSRITEKYSRPSILISFDGNPADIAPEDAVGKGSGRSIKGMNLVDALCHCSSELVKFGGHELAAGLSVKRSSVEAFRAKINEYAEKTLTEDSMVPTLNADLEIPFKECNMALADGLRIMEPYGVGNPVPNFVVRSVLLTGINPVSEGKHTRLACTDGNSVINGMFFSCSPDDLGLYVGDEVDVLFNIDINEWVGHKSVQLIIRDIKQSQTQRELRASEHERFFEVWGGAQFSAEEHILPSRDDFAVIYRLLAAAVRSGPLTLTVRDILARVRDGRSGADIGYIKLLVIIKVMQELNIMGIEEISEDTYSFKMNYRTAKAELEKSTLLRRLRSQQNN